MKRKSASNPNDPFLGEDDVEAEPIRTAIDCADDFFIRCTCGKPECFATRIQSFREHIAELYRTIQRCQTYRVLSSPDDWNAVLYPLHMAASIQDVNANTGFVDDTMSIMMCRPAYEYEVAHSDVASRYVAASSIFSFIWAAYEATVRLTAPGEFPGLLKQKAFGQRGRSLVEARPDQFRIFGGAIIYANIADRLCERGGLMDARLARVRERYVKKDFVFAAELTREFRNHLYHGEDAPPEPEDYILSGEEKPRIGRFYAVSRLALLLIQFLVRTSVEHAPAIEFGYDDETGEDILLPPQDVLSRLHLRAAAMDRTDKPEF